MAESQKPPASETVSDSPTAWFAVLERARLTDNYALADRAMRELERLGVLVRFPRQRKGANGGN
jgi:hypothetical protein